MGAGASAGLDAALKSSSESDITAMLSTMSHAEKTRLLKACCCFGPKPKVLFVLGGPGVGKGTQCAKIIENFPVWAHISAGDCLRAERNDPNSKDGELINTFIKEGKIVPVEITVKLLQKAMSAAAGKSCFLIDGFPRNLDNVRGWNDFVGGTADLKGCLFYEATAEELEKRLLGRGQGRDDDNIETIQKRFKTYVTETQPIGDLFKQEGQLISISGMAPIEEVWESTKKVIQNIEAKPKVEDVP